MKDGRVTHGMCNTPLYRMWCAVVQRCTNPTAAAYPYYGGRGIKLCDRWRDFANFFADMAPRPEGMTLDRIDNDGHYEPGNCRWVSRQVQQRNRRNNLRYTYSGEDLTLAEWAERTGMSYNTLAVRYRNGWTAKQALETPPSKRNSIKRNERDYFRDASGQFAKGA